MFQEVDNAMTEVSNVVVGIVQRNVPLNPQTVSSLQALACEAIVIDASPKPLIKSQGRIRVLHRPDFRGFFAIALLQELFSEFLKTKKNRLFLIEGDMVLSSDNIARAAACKVNTKAFYQESQPDSPHAYIRREGLAGVLLRTEVERIHEWMSNQPSDRFRKYQGYCDTFLWYAVSSESQGYSVSTSGPEWIPVLHITHDDSTRVTKAQRRDMKVYRSRMAEVINMAMECNRSE